ncbi:MAG: LemA family protein [Atribacterota bacterium]|nr:LemA family protein [Atribacterota bacterium]MDD4896588.1 LemA family protein [Atribacterota bacterium]MDD5637309.1 LemA family protein [Atribacterota bacterium]
MNFILIFLVLIAMWVVVTYNSLVSLRARVDNAWAQIDVQLKRRFDLIPNLVNTVKGYAQHEKETLEKVTEARTKYMSAQTPDEKMEANSQLAGVLGRLFAVAESYPDLKANTSFLDLQKQLKETEDKIGFSRQFYNDTAMKYNISIVKVPASIIANLFGFKSRSYFEAEGESRENVEVKF